MGSSSSIPTHSCMLIGDRKLLTSHAYVCSVLASRTTPQEELLRACQRVCELSSRCSDQPLLAFNLTYKLAGGTSTITSLLESSDKEVRTQLERRPSILGLDHACVCIANGKTHRAASVAFSTDLPN